MLYLETQSELGTIHPSALRDGQVAEIVTWDDNDEMEGVIVKRNGNYLFALDYTAVWTDIDNFPLDNYEVKIIGDGTTFIVRNNE